MSNLKQRRAEVCQLASRVLGSAQNAQDWMRQPAIGLNGQIADELSRTTDGAKQVETLLMQIAYGLYV